MARWRSLRQRAQPSRGQRRDEQHDEHARPQRDGHDGGGDARHARVEHELAGRRRRSEPPPARDSSAAGSSTISRSAQRGRSRPPSATGPTALMTKQTTVSTPIAIQTSVIIAAPAARPAPPAQAQTTGMPGRRDRDQHERDQAAGRRRHARGAVVQLPPHEHEEERREQRVEPERLRVGDALARRARAAIVPSIQPTYCGAVEPISRLDPVAPLADLGEDSDASTTACPSRRAAPPHRASTARARR